MALAGGGVVVLLVVRVVWVLEWMIVPLAVPLVRVGQGVSVGKDGAGI